LEPGPQENPGLREIDGSTKVSLHLPGKPEGRHITQPGHNLGEQMAILNSFPDALILRCDDGSDESPRRTEYREDEEVVEHEEGVQTSSDMAFPGGLRDISGVCEQSTELKLRISCQLISQRLLVRGLLTTTGTPMYIRVCTKGAKIPCAIAQPVGWA